MSAVADLEAKIAAGLVVTPAKLAEAAAADRLGELQSAIAERQAAERAASERRDHITAELDRLWFDVDTATDAASDAFDAFRAAHAALVDAVDDMLAADQAARSYVAHQHVEAHEMPPRDGRGWCDREALGGTTFTTPVAGGGREVLRIPASAPYFAWVRARRAER